jgi:UDP-N-acetyl-2-amino-2-deoxyglucuronate dehydrogenase
MSQPLGIAVIGTGVIADGHLYAYQRAQERARLMAVVDVDEERARRAAERFEVPDVYADYKDVLARDDVHAVSICTPPYLHVPMAVEALKAGKHVLCEKPVSPTLAGLDAIEEAQRASGRVFAGVFQLRFGRGAQELRALVDEGRLGRLHLGIAETLWFRDGPYYQDVSWRGCWEYECGGVTVSQAVHLIDALAWFMGRPVSVYAAAGTFRAPMEEEDTSVAVVRFENGGIGQITSTVSALGPERSRLEIYGTELSAVSQGGPYDSTAEPFLLSAAKEEDARALRDEMEQRYPKGYRVLHRGAVNDFLEAIQEGRAPLVDIEACRTALQITAGVYKSAMTGLPVDLPLTPDDPFYHELPPPGQSLPTLDTTPGVA